MTRISRRTALAGGAAMLIAGGAAAQAPQTPARPLKVFADKASEERFMALYDAIVREWPIPCREIDVPTRFGQTHVIASGPVDGPPLLLLPALGASATLWRPTIATLSRHYRTYAIDTLGEANKSRPTRFLKSRRDQADWLGEVMDGLGIRRASIAGNSYGGFLALNQAALTPERVDRLVLISPAGPKSFAPLASSFYFGIINGVLRGGDTMGKWLLNGTTYPASEARWLELSDIGVAGRKPALFGPGDIPPAELARIRNPTLLLIGDREVIYDPKTTLERARRRMPGLTAELVPGANHVAGMTQPAYVADRIVRFLDGDSAPGL